MVAYNTTEANNGSGIVTEGVVIGNYSASNTSRGLLATSITGYDDNVLGLNGATVTSGVQIGTNLCKRQHHLPVGATEAQITSPSRSRATSSQE